MIQVASRSPSTERGSTRSSRFMRSRTSSWIAFAWRGFWPVQTTKKSVYVQTGRMSRMTTSRASFSCATAATRRACSSGVSGPRASFRPGLQCTGLPRTSIVAVEAKLLDQPSHGRRNEVVERLAVPAAGPDLGRRDGRRRDLEERHATGILEAAEDALQLLAVVAGPRRHAEAREPQHLVRLAPRGELRELVGADEEDELAVALARPAGRLDRVRRLASFELPPGELDALPAREGGLGKAVPHLGGRADLLVRRAPRGDDDHALEREVVESAVDERDVAVVRRIERAAEESGHSSTCTSSPTSISCPRRAPAARSASTSSLSSAGGVPTTR